MRAALDELRQLLPPDRIDTGPVSRAVHAQDFWPRAVAQRRAGRPLVEPEAVVRPRRREEVLVTMRWAHQHGIGVVPFGAGTGVCGGALPVTGAITLDLGGLNHIGALDPDSGLIEVEPGVVAQRLEDHLRHRGWTLGHFPSSIHASTIGGLLAVRSAGQASSFYGKLEDAVAGLEVVLPDGTLVWWRPQPASAAGPDLKRLFLGAEGTLGVIIGATLRIWPAPEVTIDRGILYPDVATGLAAARALMRSGLRPHVFRLYDPADTALLAATAGLELPAGCLCVLGVEGSRRVAPTVAELLLEVALAAGGTDLGPGPGEHWRRHRYDVSYRFADVMAGLGAGTIVDTLEVAAPWRTLLDLYEAVGTALRRHSELVLAHFSHIYLDGSSIYFTFLITAEDEERALDRYDRAWTDAMGAALDLGATTTHHHGVGLLRARWLQQELGPGGWTLLRRIKAALDPHGIANPTKLGLGRAP